MPELDDARSLEQISAANLASDDFAMVFSGSRNRVVRVPTGTDSLLEQLQGAEEDPTRIGAEYLPETIEASVVLDDMSAVVLPAGTLGGGSTAGTLYVHDGVREGGVPVPVGYDDFHVRKGVLIPNASVVAGTAIVELGRIRLPNSYFVNNQVIYFDAEILVTGTTYAGSFIGVGFHFDGQTDLLDPFEVGARLFNIAANFNVNQKVSAYGSIGITDTSGVFSIAGGGLISSVRCPVGAATGSLSSEVIGSLPDGGAAIGGDIIVTARVGIDAAMSGNPIQLVANIKAHL